MNSFVKSVEIFAGIMLLCMALLTSTSAFTRYIFSRPVPDEYDISRLTLGVVACWGMAAAFRHKDHIQLDLFWGKMERGTQRLLTRIGAAICLMAIAFFSWALLAKAYDSYLSNIVSIELGLPIWIFYMPAWLGTLATLVVLAGEIISPSDEDHEADYGY